MRRFLSLGLGLVAIAVMSTALALLSPGHAPSTARVSAQENPRESSCIADGQKHAFPKVLLLGETTTITLTARAVCAGEQIPLHIVLVLDASGSMAGDPTRQMKDAAKKLIEKLGMRDNPGTKVGVVEFNGTARALCQLTNNEGQAKGCVSRVGATGGTCIDCGIREGLRVLLNGRRREQGDSALNEVMVVLSDGTNNAGCPPVVAASRQAKSQGIIVITVCVGSGCDAQCMREAASSARYFFQSDDAGGLIAVFERIRKDIQKITLRKMTIIDTLPPNMEYIENSSEPQADVSPGKDQLTWTQNFVPSDGLTMSFKVRPKDVGFWPTNVLATGEFRDNQDRTGTIIFQVPWVTVLQPFPQATPTDAPTPTNTPTLPPTNTPTNTPTTGPTPTNTPTPTPTNTPKPPAIYLPIMVKERCPTRYLYTFSDVALVLDMSTSMDRESAPDSGRSKQAAVIEAAKMFVGQMQLAPNQFGQHDQVSIVWFNNKAEIEQQLTNDAGALHAALDRLPMRRAEFTRLDLAFERGAEALPAHLRKLNQGNYPNGDKIPDNIGAIVMLTDGLPNRVPAGPTPGCAHSQSQEDTVLCRADAAKAQGFVVFTIGVGKPKPPIVTDPRQLIDAVDVQLLTECATDPTKFYLAPTAEDVSGILDLIHDEQVDTCPPTDLWPSTGW